MKVILDELAPIVDAIFRVFAEITRYVEHTTYVSPETGRMLLSAGVIFVLFLSASLYARQSVRTRDVAVVALLIPAVLMIVDVGRFAIHGQPDDRCDKYGEGTIPFTLLSFPVGQPKDMTNPFGDSWLLMLVESRELWGTAPHLCRISRSGESGQRLERVLEVYRKDLFRLFSFEGDGSYGGRFTFTFGNGRESPNVTLNLPEEPSSKGGPRETARGI
ncbi:MAG: hypothetical protein HYS26_01935 [Candidatus Kaiserbacteria bacterium]|nr:MAG: hypothetical protein HYS26_01935 [Candidatus Kaiserbacteria bacterium]